MTYDYDELFPGRFLKSGEFKGKDVTLTIRGIRIEELPQEKGGSRARGIIAFDGTKKELVLNRTNGECIKAMFSRDTGKWIGKRVTFFPAPFTDSFTGEVGTAIRVRGSPELAADMSVEVRLPKRKPMTMVLRATGIRPATAATPPQNGNGKQKKMVVQDSAPAAVPTQGEAPLAGLPPAEAGADIPF